MKRKNAGFTLYELIIVMAIIAIISGIAVPNMIGWRDRSKIKAAFENTRGDLQWAKTRAIRDHDKVAVVFEADRYVMYNTTGAIIRSRQLPTGVVIDLAASTIPADPDNLSQLKTLFEVRGRCDENSNGDLTAGLLVLKSSVGDQRRISINPLGQIRQE